MSTARPEIGIVVRAIDQASRIFNRISNSSGLLGRSWRSLIGIVGTLSRSMLALSVALPIVAAAFASLITVTTAINFVTFERATRRTRVQLQLLGFSATAARDQVSTLTNLMDRAAATSFFTSQEAINNVALAGFELNAQLIPLAEKFGDIIGANPSEVFNALFDAFARHDPTKFALLVTGVTDLAIPMQVLDELEAGNAAPFLLWLQRVTEGEQLTRLEEVATSLERIAEITRPTREAIVTSMAQAVEILLESLATHLENGSARIETAIKTAFVAGVILAGNSLGRSLGIGLLAGLSILLLGNITDTVDSAIEDPVVVAGILAAGLGLGLKLGGAKGGIVGGIVIALGLQLLPGLTEAFNDLETNQQLQVTAIVLGTSIGLGLKLGVLRSFALGLVLREIIGDLNTQDTITDQALFVALIALGAAMGFAIGGPMGAVVGASLAIAVEDMLQDSALMDKFLELGDRLATVINTGVLNGLSNLPSEIANLGIRAINDILNAYNAIPFLPDTSTIPLVPLPNVGSLVVPPFVAPVTPMPPFTGPLPFIGPIQAPTTEGGTPTGPGPGGSPFGGIGSPTFPDLDFGDGGVVPGPLGAPVMATVHGGEAILPGGGTFIVQLVLDRRIIGSVAVDAVNKTARHNAGMVPGAIGS